MDSVMPRIFLDLDGVLADFDKGAGIILETDNIYKWEFIHGGDRFWEVLNSFPNFFGSLPLMPDAMELWWAVRERKPTILTALPRQDAASVDAQKRAWVAKYLGSDVEVITCKTKDKPKFCRTGDILIDDRSVNREAWNAAGGTYILHTSAQASVHRLRALGAI